MIQYTQFKHRSGKLFSAFLFISILANIKVWMSTCFITNKWHCGKISIEISENFNISKWNGAPLGVREWWEYDKTIRDVKIHQNKYINIDLNLVLIGECDNNVPFYHIMCVKWMHNFHSLGDSQCIFMQGWRTI